MIRVRTLVTVATMAVTVALAAPSGGDPACGEPDEIHLMAAPSSFSQVTALAAVETGLFRKYCLDARLVPVEGANVAFARVLTRTLDVAETSVGELLAARTKDLKVKAVAGASDGVPWALVARAGVPLPNAATGYPAVMKDLAGRTIGVPRLGDGGHRFTSMLFGGARTQPGAWVGLAAMPQQLAALDSGAVDAVMLADPGVDVAVAGGATIAIDLRKPGTGPPQVQRLGGTYHVKIASEAFLRDRADVVRRYVVASEEIVRWVRDPANFGDVVKYVRAAVTPGRDIPDGDRVFTDVARRYVATVSTSISRRSVEAWYAYEAAASGLKSRVRFEDVVWSEAPIAP